MEDISRRGLIWSAAGAALFAAAREAEAQFNGCPSGFCPGNVLGGASVQPLVLPIASPLAVYSVVRLSTWSGSCLQVKRSSDSATLDIGFRGNVVDAGAADTFAGGSALTITKWYDQMGSGNDFAPQTTAEEPSFTQLNALGGIRPVTMHGTAGATDQALVASLTANSNALTSYMVAAPRTAFNPASFWEFSDAGLTASYISALNNSGPFIVSYTGLTGNTNGYCRSHLSVISCSTSGTNGIIVRTNGSEYTRVNGAGSNVVGKVRIGKNIAAAVAVADYFAFIIYGAAHTSAQMQSVEAVLTSTFRRSTSFQKRLIYGGESLIVGWYSTLNQQPPWQGGFGKGSDWETMVMAVGGRTSVAEYGARATYTGLVDGTKARNTCIIGSATNDINAQTFADQAAAEAYADTLYSGTTVPFVAALKAGSFDGVVVPTTIARGTILTSNFREYARLRHNLNVVNGAAANGYLVSDRAALAQFSTPASANDTTYYTSDKVHLTVAGAGLLEGVDKPVILAA